MSITIEATYKAQEFLYSKKNFILNPGPSRIRFQNQKTVIMIDLTPSMYSYHSGLKDVIYNQIVPTLRVLIKSMYDLSIDLELSVICTRMSSAPLSVIVHSYKLKSSGDSKHLMRCIKFGLNKLHSNPSLTKDDGRNIKFNTVLKWSLFSLEMMEKDRLPSLLLITNTVNSFVSSAIYDGLIMQYCANDVSFNIIALCRESGLRFGLNSDYLFLKDAAKTTGGKFIWADKIKNKIEKIFTRKLFRKNKIMEKFLINDHSISIKFDDLIECRLREGFLFCQKEDDTIVLSLYCGKGAYVFYHLKEAEKFCIVKVFIAGSETLAGKIREKLKAKTINIKDAEPSFEERISWIIYNINETENFAVYLEDLILSKSNYSRLISTNLNIWHRWMNVKRLDIIFSKTNNEFALTQGRKKLTDGLHHLFKLNENDLFIEHLPDTIALAKIVWEGVNKAVLFIAGYGKSIPDKVEEFKTYFKRISGIDIFIKPLGKMIVETISNSQNYSTVSVQSAQTYKPHIEAVKAYLLKKNSKYRLMNTDWYPILVNLLYDSTVKEGFFYIGNCQNGKSLLLKSLKLKDRDQPIFLQFLIYMSQGEVNTEFYIDPQIINNEELWIEPQRALERVHDFVFRSLCALDYVIYAALRRKLNDEDYFPEEFAGSKVFKLSTSDDIYCYIENLNQSYRQSKKSIRKNMLKILQKYQQVHEDRPKISILMKHSHYVTQMFDNFMPTSDPVKIKSAKHEFYQNLTSACVEVSDFHSVEQKFHYFVRYLEEQSVVLWVLPPFESFLLSTKHHFPINFYHCSLSRVDANNSEPIKIREKINSVVFSRTLSLIQKVYSSVYNFTFCKLFEEVQLSERSLINVIKNCRKEEQVIDCSGIFKLIHKNWNDCAGLVDSVFSKCIGLMSDDFYMMDQEFISELDRSFIRIGNTNLYIFKKTEEGVFLKFGSFSNKLSHCLKEQKVSFEIFSFPKEHFFSKEIQFIKKIEVETQSEILNSICKKASSLISQQALKLLLTVFPKTEKIIDQVKCHLKNISETITLTHTLDLVTKSLDTSDIMHSELQKNQVLYCNSINNTYYLISSETNKNFFLQGDYEKSSCDWNCKEEEASWVDFWVLFSIPAPNTLTFHYFLPKDLEFTNLTKEIIRARLIRQSKKLEQRVNQRILLKSLRETGKISTMLIPDQLHDPVSESKSKPNDISKTYRRREEVIRKQSIKTQGFYKLPIQLIYYFSITDKIVQSEVLKYLASKYSIHPFSIDNLEGMFMLINKQEVNLFNFVDTEIKTTSNFKIRSGKGIKEQQNVNLKYIRLQVYGIDPPNEDTIEKLKKNIDELLQQMSIARLADLLTKNAKRTMTTNDYQFITEGSFPQILMYPISSVISNYELLTAMIKQNLMRFLSPFSIQETIVLVYNFLNIFETNTSKKKTSQSSKNIGPVNFLGNTFGKALALITYDIVYFDGENLTDYKPTGELDELLIDPKHIKKEFEGLEKFSNMPSPCNPGCYLEIKISQKGFINREAFNKQLDSCIKQSIFEFILERIQEKCLNLPFSQRFGFCVEASKASLDLSFKNRQVKIPHYCHWQNIFLIYSQILGIVEEQLDHKIKFCYGFSNDLGSICSKSRNEVEDQWKLMMGEENIGRPVVLSAIIDLDNLNDSNIQDLKFYLTETLNGVFIKRSIYIFIEVTNEFLQVSTYNLNKPSFFKIQNAIELHINWTRERFIHLNTILMQKLGLFYHQINLKSTSQENQVEIVHNVLPKACCLLEVKETKKNFSAEAFINPHEITHTENNVKETPQDIKLKGAYPLIRYAVNKTSDEDHVRRHSFNMTSFLDKKNDHISEYENCALACVRWTKMTDSPIDKMILKISRSAKARDEINLMKHILGSSHLFLKVNSRFYMQAADKSGRIHFTLCELLKSYTEKLIKVTKFDPPMQSEPKSYRKNSYEDPENPFKFIKNFYSSGALLNESKKIENMQSYLKRQYDKALIVIEVSYENSFIYTNGYCIENFNKCFPMSRWEDYEFNSNVTKEISRLKLNLDPISNLYDIHIRCLGNSLESMKDNSEIDIIKTITLILQEFKKPPRKCSNYLGAFYVYIHLGDDNNWTAEEFFTFFLINCKEKGFNSVTHPKKPKFAYKKLQDVIDDVNFKGKNSVKWLILTHHQSKVPMYQNELAIKCCLLKCDEARKFKNDILRSIKKGIETDITNILNEYKEYYKRDQLWNKIREQNIGFSFEDFELLLKASKVSRMYEIDNRIKYLTSFKNVFTINCVKYLTEAYSKSSKMFEIGSEVHLLIIFSQKILAYLVLNKEEQSLQISSVKRSVGCSQKEEDDLITDLINKIIQWLWVRFTTNEKL